MMANPFDQFDTSSTATVKNSSERVNPFDQFDDGIQKPTAPSGIVQGLKDLPIGTAQLLTQFNESALPGRAIADKVMNSIGLGGVVEARKNVDNNVLNTINEHEANYQSQRAAAGETGFDGKRVIGNLINPANFVLGALTPIRAASIGGRVVQGARAGAVGSTAAPVTEGDDYWSEKAKQIAIGGVGGGVLAPVLGKVTDKVVKFFKPSQGEVAAKTEEVVQAGLNSLKDEGVEINSNLANYLRQQVQKAIDSGVVPDVPAMARKADFEALGIKPTLGQITRDAGQFAKEKNLRGVSGVGDELLTRFEQQNNTLSKKIGSYADGAMDEYGAGTKLRAALKQVDDTAKEGVDAAYSTARDSAGRAAPMNSGQFSEAANKAIDENMLNNALPAEVRGILNNVTTGEIPLNVNSYVLIDRRLSDIQRDMTRQGNGSAALAVGKVRDALHKTGVADDVGTETKALFDSARGVAKARFDQKNMIPALKAAADGDVAADDFVKRFVVNGKADDLKRMVDVLPGDGKQEVRRQLSEVLRRSAYGENPAGDNAFSPTRFAQTLRTIGKQKLSTVFSPDEIAEFERIGRVGAYMNSIPSSSPVNTSNTASALVSMLGRIPGVPASVGLLNSAKNAATNHIGVRNAIAATVPLTKMPLTPNQSRMASLLLGGGALSGGAALSNEVNN